MEAGEAQEVAKMPADIKADIEELLAEKDVLEGVVPSSLVIGAFLVNREGLRQALSKKKKAQAAALLGYLAKVLYMNCCLSEIRASHNVLFVGTRIFLFTYLTAIIISYQLLTPEIYIHYRAPIANICIANNYRHTSSYDKILLHSYS